MTEPTSRAGGPAPAGAGAAALSPVLPLLLAALLAAGCASTPRESVELSETVGRDLAQVQAGYRQLAKLHFDHLLGDVDAFVEEEYRPFVVARSLEELDLLSDLRAALEGTGDLDPLDLLGIYVEETTAQIDSFRTALRRPVVRQREEVLERIDLAFQRLQTANAAVTGYLASVYEVHAAQDELLRTAGLGDLRSTLASGMATVSERLEEVLERGRRAEADLDELPRLLGRALEEGDWPAADVVAGGREQP